MYIFPEMIEMGLKEGEKWSSEDHREVAMTVCLCNPLITSRDDLQHNVGIINSISQENIRTVTGADLIELGCNF